MKSTIRVCLASLALAVASRRSPAVAADKFTVQLKVAAPGAVRGLLRRRGQGLLQRKSTWT